ncbi:MAG TPA: hypothetical protein VLM40_05980 [Gemmata sp.]|nr:hypothetical protein [Gemmata sp.]
MVLGLFISSLLVLLGIGTGARQLATMRRLRDEAYTPDVDRIYYRGQTRRRLTAGVLLFVIGGMIGYYYLSGMDARMDAIPERNKAGAPQNDPQAEADKAFTRTVGIYFIVILVLLGIVGCVAVLDFWATRVYWLARYREMKADHETKLQRDLAVFRQTMLNDRAKGLKKPGDDTPLEGQDSG